MVETSSPSAAVLRRYASSIALDLAHAPLKSEQYNRLSDISKQFLLLEKTMTTTSEHVREAIGHAEEVLKEARSWKSICDEGGTLGSFLDQSIARISARIHQLVPPVTTVTFMVFRMYFGSAFRPSCCGHAESVDAAPKFRQELKVARIDTADWIDVHLLGTPYEQYKLTNRVPTEKTI